MCVSSCVVCVRAYAGWLLRLCHWPLWCNTSQKCYMLCSTQHCLSPLPSLNSLSHVKQGLHASGSRCWLKHCAARGCQTTRTTRPDNHPAKDAAQQLQLALRHKPAAAAPAAPTPPTKPQSAAAAHWRGLACRTTATRHTATQSAGVQLNMTVLAFQYCLIQVKSIRTQKSVPISL